MTLAPTLHLTDAARRCWDVVVVGAGPAGALAAHQLAGAGLAVLLVDKADFPRWKVCGSCLNGRALGLLREAGLGGLPSRLGAVPLRALFLSAARSHATVSLPEGAALSRPAFDTALVQAAVDNGASFLPRTQASLGAVTASGRDVCLRQNDAIREVRTRLVLAADGLGGRLLRGEALRAAPDSRIGAGVLAEDGPDFFAAGTIYMACGEGGYVGLVRVEDGRLDVAAAFDPDRVRASGGLGRAAARILRQAGLPPVPGLEALAWRGTPTLTRRAPRLAAERLFVLGDAAGYVEPFTGEGIAWALASARAVAPLATDAAACWEPALVRRWPAIYRRTVARRQFFCRVLSRLLRHPTLTGALIAVLAHAPRLAEPFVRRLNLPSPQR